MRLVFLLVDIAHESVAVDTHEKSVTEHKEDVCFGFVTSGFASIHAAPALIFDFYHSYRFHASDVLIELSDVALSDRIVREVHSIGANSQTNTRMFKLWIVTLLLMSILLSQGALHRLRFTDQESCSAGETPCPLGNGFACCPSPNACCCPDEKYCCTTGVCVCAGYCPGANCTCTAPCAFVNGSCNPFRNCSMAVKRNNASN